MLDLNILYTSSLRIIDETSDTRNTSLMIFSPWLVITWIFPFSMSHHSWWWYFFNLRFFTTCLGLLHTKHLLVATRIWRCTLLRFLFPTTLLLCHLQFFYSRELCHVISGCSHNLFSTHFLLNEISSDFLLVYSWSPNLCVNSSTSSSVSSFDHHNVSMTSCAWIFFTSSSVYSSTDLCSIFLRGKHHLVLHFSPR